MAMTSDDGREPPPLRSSSADGSKYWTAERLPYTRDWDEPPGSERLYLHADQFAGPLWSQVESTGMDEAYLAWALGLSPEPVQDMKAWNKAHYLRDLPVHLETLAAERLRSFDRLRSEVPRASP